MVQIIPAGTPKGPSFGQKLSAGIERGLDVGQQLMQTYQQEQAATKLGLDPTVLRSLDPQTRSDILGEALRQNIKVQRAGKTADINLQQPEGATPEQRAVGRGQEFLEEVGSRQKFQAPEFMQEPGKAPKGPGRPSPSMMPQPATTGQKVPVLDPRGVIAEGKRIQQEALEAGQPMDQFDAWQLAHQQNQANIAHNAAVESEQETARVAQRDYGTAGEEAITNVYPEASDEIKAFFQKKGEEAAGKYKSEAEIKRHLAVEARKFKNTIANVRESIGPPRATSTQKMLGTGREADAIKISFRNKLKPLLEQGFYDTARNELSKLGYHPEERETILTDLGEGSLKALGEMPQMTREKKAGEVSFAKGYFEKSPIELNPLNDAQRSIFRNNLTKSLQQDPSANLILLRKQYEDKGVDWREFSSAVNDMIYNQELQLNPDQFSMLDVIDMPPLDELDKILHKAKLVGR